MKPYIRKARNREKRPSKEEVLKLYKNGMTQKEIGKMLGWTQPGVSELMKRYGITTRKNKKWGKKEEEILKKFYLKVPRKNLQKLIISRSWGAIKLKALKLNLSRPKKEHNYSDEVKQRLRKLAKQKLIKVKFDRRRDLAYIVGVLDGDGYTNKKHTIGLETKSREFAKKFKKKLKSIGLNSNMKFSEKKRYWLVWGCSKQLIRWYLSLPDKKKIEWLLKKKVAWEYLEGLYDSDGSLHPCGCPQICGTNLKKNIFVSNLLTSLNISNTVHQDKVWIQAKSVPKFFSHICSIISYRNPKNSARFAIK